MSEPSTAASDLQQKYARFLDLTPLATALAGLPVSEGRLFLDEQIDGRAITIRSAFRMADSLWEELTGGDPAKARELRDLLPLTLTLAGLPPSPKDGRLYSPDQVEARAITVRAAYRVARATARECLRGS
jgi:hypothetical protein